jgi:hypothetical protein
MRKLVVLVLVALGLLLVTPAIASASTPTLKSLATSLAALQKQVARQRVQIAVLNRKLAKARSLLALAPYLSVTQAALNGVAGPNIVFHGCNVHVMSSTSETDGSGLGNLIVGWDHEPYGTLPSPFRSGSNNLVCGNRNNFTGAGGFVAGLANAVSGLYSSVSGGSQGGATGPEASVSGGYGNAASAIFSSVSGGSANWASAQCASIAGGQINIASGEASSILGGQENNATGNSSTVGGGNLNSASGDACSILGGDGNNAKGNSSTVGGGHDLINSSGLFLAEGSLQAN